MEKTPHYDSYVKILEEELIPAMGCTEPIGALLTILAASWVLPALPVLLAFAAGAMMYVVVEELIPEAQLGEHSHAGTISVMAGFLVMMLLDVVLG